jgi:hypothetical protein
MLADMLGMKAFMLLRANREADAVREFSRALASADKADRHPSAPARRGLRAAWIMGHASEALFKMGRRAEAREMAAQARARMRVLIESDPFLATARAYLGLAAFNAARFALEEWNFDEFVAANNETQPIFSELLKFDPKDRNSRNNLAVTWSSHSSGRFAYHWERGEFVPAEAALSKGIELLSADDAMAGERRNLLVALLNQARLCAAMGRNDKVLVQLAEAASLRDRIASERRYAGTKGELDYLGGGIGASSGAGREYEFRRVDFERLNWAAMRRNAVATLQRLRGLTIDPSDEMSATRIREAAEVDLMRAAYEMGDDSAVLAEMKRSGWTLRIAGAEADMQQRYERVRDQLAPIHVLARSGELDAARSALTRLWPEVEAIAAAAGERPRALADVARALVVKADIAAADRREQRQLLQRAEDYLRPAAAAGKLTRYEREVVLAGLEKQLAALPGVETP